MKNVSYFSLFNPSKFNNTLFFFCLSNNKTPVTTKNVNDKTNAKLEINNHILNLFNSDEAYEKIKGLNYFQLFNIPVKYDIDLNSIHKTYKTLLKKSHPDLCKLQSANDISTFIIGAYKTLRNDVNRAEYLLKLKGCFDLYNKNLGENHLKKMFEIQEKIESSESKERCLKLKDDVVGKIREFKKEIGGLFEERKYAEIVKILEEVKYYNQVVNHINKKFKLL